jgi:TonB family protein
MKTLTTLAIFTTFTLTALTAEAQEHEAACTPTIVAMRADFPPYAQELRQHGVVELTLRLGSDGRVAAARVTQSSGHALLDNASVRSARDYWRFAVKDCTATDLNRERMVTVTYQRPPGLTLSGTINRKAIIATRKLHADNQCHATHPVHELTVFTCLGTPSGNTALELADALK